MTGKPGRSGRPRNPRVAVECAWCGAPLDRTPYQISQSNYSACGRHCVSRYYAANFRPKAPLTPGRRDVKATLSPLQYRVACELGDGAATDGIRRALNIVMTVYGRK